jgi:hypothetical protein
MRNFIDFQVWKTHCRGRGWTGPRWTADNELYEFVDSSGRQKATWDPPANRGVILDERNPLDGSPETIRPTNAE